MKGVSYYTDCIEGFVLWYIRVREDKLLCDKVDYALMYFHGRERNDRLQTFYALTILINKYFEKSVIV